VISGDSKTHHPEKNLDCFVKSGSLNLCVVGGGKLACDSGVWMEKYWATNIA